MVPGHVSVQFAERNRHLDAYPHTMCVQTHIPTCQQQHFAAGHILPQPYFQPFAAASAADTTSAGKQSCVLRSGSVNIALIRQPDSRGKELCPQGCSTAAQLASNAACEQAGCGRMNRIHRINVCVLLNVCMPRTTPFGYVYRMTVVTARPAKSSNAHARLFSSCFLTTALACRCNPAAMPAQPLVHTERHAMRPHVIRGIRIHMYSQQPNNMVWPNESHAAAHPHITQRK